jgi:endogenous inhibitor of DNA gyrase (YacG/DUF329 family)
MPPDSVQTLLCDHCGRPVARKTGRRTARTYCSAACRSAAWRRRRTEARIARIRATVQDAVRRALDELEDW